MCNLESLGCNTWTALGVPALAYGTRRSLVVCRAASRESGSIHSLTIPGIDLSRERLTKCGRTLCNHHKV